MNEELRVEETIRALTEEVSVRDLLDEVVVELKQLRVEIIKIKNKIKRN